jgi:L-serine deaminase
VNIADMDVGRATQPGSAIMLVSVSDLPTDDVLGKLRATAGIISVHALSS